ncbi:hypothetical protein BD289DRAFT_441150 [Coniella lustricola]|uniref:Uncharacterized protein n=1 Tax=Coniella lustricola TaxID=2025994 RepID=A0A2T2ZZU0_9PEZI|nr:hypothetical protein BD289DRAFT_441150 [Coniella lustricola]
MLPQHAKIPNTHHADLIDVGLLGKRGCGALAVGRRVVGEAFGEGLVVDIVPLAGELFLQKISQRTFTTWLVLTSHTHTHTSHIWDWESGESKSTRLCVVFVYVYIYIYMYVCVVEKRESVYRWRIMHIPGVCILPCRSIGLPTVSRCTRQKTVISFCSGQRPLVQATDHPTENESLMAVMRG